MTKATHFPSFAMGVNIQKQCSKVRFGERVDNQIDQNSFKTAMGAECYKNLNLPILITISILGKNYKFRYQTSATQFGFVLTIIGIRYQRLNRLFFVMISLVLNSPIPLHNLNCYLVRQFQEFQNIQIHPLIQNFCFFYDAFFRKGDFPFSY